MGGDKSRVELDGRPLLQWVLDTAEQVADTIVLSVAAGQRTPDLRTSSQLLVCEDVVADHGPLAGVHAGFEATRDEHLLIVPCDAPLLEPDLLRLLLSLSEGFDAVIPMVDGKEQTTVAVYARSSRPAMADALNSPDLSMRGMLRQLHVRYVEDEELRAADPALHSFINVNTVADLEAVRAIVSQPASSRQSKGR